ncbi:MAG: conjugal transfer protein TraG N-terminal domain-containing protein [Thermodesulfobacteriota bacterium]
MPSSLQTITVQGGFDVYAQTFRRLALIMSDTRYNNLFFTFIVVGIFIAGCVVIGHAVFEGKDRMHSWVAWLGAVVFGLIIFKTFIQPRSPLVIHDESSNQSVTIADVPDGVIFVAGLAKKIENGLIHIIETSGSPDSYIDNPGGVTFNIFSKAFAKGVDLSGVGATGGYLNTNLRSYVKDCLFFEIARPGTTLTLDQININTDFIPIFAQGSNPALFTVYRDNSHPTGVTDSCYSAWAQIQTELLSLTETSSANEKYWTERCLRAGYNHNVVGAVGPDMVTLCRTKAAELLSNARLLGVALTSSQLMRQHLMASELYGALQEANPDSAIRMSGAMNMGSSLVGAGIVAGEWMPHMQAMLFAVFVGIMPFFLILAATPFYARVISFILGAFVFFVSWGVCDALLHEFAMDKALDIMTEIRNGQLGLKSFLLFQSDSMKAYACFAQYKIMSIMFAGIFAGVLTRIGGSMWAKTLGAPGSQMSRFGAIASGETIDPVRSAGRKSALTEAVPAEVLHDRYGMANQARTNLYARATEYQTKEAAVNAFGGISADPLPAADVMSGANLTQLTEKVAHADAVQAWGNAHGLSSDDTIRMTRDYLQHASASSALAMNKIAREYNISPMEALDFAKHIQTETGYGDALGVERAYQSATQDGFSGTIADYQAMRAEIDSRKGFLTAGAVRKMAETYFDGNTQQLLRHEAEYSQSQTAAMLRNFSNHRAAPEEVGEAIGRAKSFEALAKEEHLFAAGDHTYFLTQSGQLYEAAVKHLRRNAVDEIASQGSLSGQTLADIKALQDTDMGRTQLRAQGGLETTIRGEREAHNFSRYLETQGVAVQSRDLVGARTSLNLYTDNDGNLKTGFIAVNKGTVITSQDYKEYKGALSKDQAQKLGLTREGFYSIKSSPAGGAALLVHGESGRMFTKSDLHVEKNSNDGYQVVYRNPETGETGYTELSQGTEAKDVASTVRHLRSGETLKFQDDNGELTLVSGEIRSKGIMQDISGILDNGRSVSFRYNTVTGHITDRTLSQDVNFKPDEAYRNLYDKSHGNMLRFYDLNDEATRLAFVNNMAQTVGNIIGVDEVQTVGAHGGLDASLGVNAGKKGFDLSGGLDLSFSSRQKINQVSASLLHVIKESEDKNGKVDYEKAESLLRNECDGLTRRGYKAGKIGLTSESLDGQAAREHFQERFDKVQDQIIPPSIKKSADPPDT